MRGVTHGCYATRHIEISGPRFLESDVGDHSTDAAVTAFDQCYKNDETGRLAYDPAMLLKIILYMLATMTAAMFTQMVFAVCMIAARTG